MPPPKRVKQTDAIFEQLKRVNPEADRAEDTLRISIDAKATVNVGPFSRRGRSRTRTKAADHDFKPEATLTPFGIFLPQYDDLWLYMARSKVTSDFIVDRLEQWWQEVRLRFLSVKTLVINLDNGPENHSRRTQFLKRVVEFARKYRPEGPVGVLPAVPQQVQPDRAVLGHAGDALERVAAGLDRGGGGLRRVDDLEGEAPGGQRGGDDLRHGGEAEAGGDEGVGVSGRGAGRLVCFKSLRPCRQFLGKMRR